MRFLDNSASTIWEEDYTGTSLLPKGGQPIDPERRMDEYARAMGFSTRVIAFFYDKKEYSEEIDYLRKHSMQASNRYNLRIGLVTD